MVIPEVFLPPLPPPSPHSSKPSLPSNATSGFEGRVTPNFLLVLANNSEQIHRYLRAYQEYAGGDFPATLVGSLDVQLARAHDLHAAILLTPRSHVNQAELTAVAQAYTQYMTQARTMCQGVWAKFDDGAINKGMLVLCAVLCFNVLLSLLKPSEGAQNMECFVIVGFMAAMILAVAFVGADTELLVSVAFYLVIFCILLLICITVYSRLHLPTSGLTFSFWRLMACTALDSAGVHLVAMATVALHCISLLSNSFILYEGDVVSFLLQSLLALQAVQSLRRINSRGSAVQLSTLFVTVLLPFLSLGAVVRVTKVFFSCRDLQVGCVATTLTTPLSVLPNPSEPSSVLRFLLSCVLTCAVPLCLACCIPDVCRRYLSWPLRVLVRFGLPLAGLGTCASWALEGLQLGSGGGRGHILVSRAVCALCGVTALVCAVKPYEHPKVVIVKGSPPGPGGVPTVVLLVLVMSLWIPITLVLNDGVALSSVLMVIQVAVFLWISVRYGLQGEVLVLYGMLTTIHSSAQQFWC